MYRQANETPRCKFCGGGDIHTFTCWGVYQEQRKRDAKAAPTK